MSLVRSVWCGLGKGLGTAWLPVASCSPIRSGDPARRPQRAVELARKLLSNKDLGEDRQTVYPVANPLPFIFATNGLCGHLYAAVPHLCCMVVL